MHSLVMFYYVYVLYFDFRNLEMNPLESSVKSGGCSQTCSAGPPGPPGVQGEPGLQGKPGSAGKNGIDGAKGDDGSPGRDGKDGSTGPAGEKGDRGLAGSPGQNGSRGPNGLPGQRGYRGEKGECITRQNPGWCYLDRFYQETKSKKYTYFFETLPSTKKHIIVIECPSNTKNFSQSIFLCSSLCGRMFLPSSQKENDEIVSILGRNNMPNNFWIRFSDAGREGSWRDIENNAVVNYTNWNSGQPSSSKSTYDYTYMYQSSGKWWSTSDQSFSAVICELP